MKTKRTFTAAEKQAWKEEQIAEQKRLLESAVAELTAEDAWMNWILYGRNNLRKYSFNNALMIWSQKKTATLVHGKKQWENEGIALNSDAKPIKIFAPMFFAKKDANGKEELDENGKPKKKVWFKIVTVYDITDTDAPEAQAPVMLDVEGDDLADHIAALEGFARDLGFFVRYQDDTGKALGWCDYQNHDIIVNKHLTGNGTVRVLVHELCHAYGDINYQDYGRENAEVLVESATLMALGLLGFDVSKSSVPYIAQWGEGSLDALKKYAATVDDLVRTLTNKMGV